MYKDDWACVLPFHGDTIPPIGYVLQKMWGTILIEPEAIYMESQNTP
jgi:hypothetical protein